MAEPVDPQKSTPLFHQIKNRILTQIASKQLVPHDQLPSEREYQAFFGASRQTVRRALDELVIGGVLYRRPGKGTYVADPPRDMPWAAVVGLTTILAASPEFAYETIALDTRLCPSFACDLLDLPDETEVVYLEQVMLVRGQARQLHRSYLPLAVGSKLIRSGTSNLPVHELLVRVCGQRPIRSRDHLSPALASQADAALLGIPSGSAVQVLKGVIVSVEGQRIEAHEIAIRGDLFKLDFEFTIDVRP